jgi:transaldolase
MAGMIARGEIRGVTSNPSIFMNAIANSSDYDESLKPLSDPALSAEEVFFRLAIEDIQAAADLFLPLYQGPGRRRLLQPGVSPFWRT